MNSLSKLQGRYIFLGIILLIFILKFNLNSREILDENLLNKTDEISKKTELINFGVWQDENAHFALGVVESDYESLISAEISGTIANVYVQLGDKVEIGQKLASFKRTGDSSFINYQNSLNNLQTTKLANDSQIQLANLNIKNVQQELQQLINQQNQVREQAFTNLVNTVQTSETNFLQALDVIDKYTGASPKYNFTQVAGRYVLGANDKLTKQNIINEIIILRNLANNLTNKPLAGFENSEEKQLSYAQNRLDFGKKLKISLHNFSQLIDHSLPTKKFNDFQVNQVKNELVNLEVQINSEISKLANQLKNAQTIEEQIKSNILQVENKLAREKSNLDLIKSQNKTRLVGAQNQVNITSLSKSDLDIFAPISGKISEKFIKNNQQVTRGSKLFLISNNQLAKKVIANLTEDELNNLKNNKYIFIKTNNGENLIAENFTASDKIDPTTQKIRVEFLLNNNINVLTGSLVQVLIPLTQKSAKILPISAISFEPDGAEVLILNQANIAERKKVKTGKIIGNNIEIIAGLKQNDLVIKYQNRINPGEKITKK